MKIPNLTLEFKNRLFASKADFHFRSIKAFPGYVQGINTDDLVSGKVGIYVKPILQDENGKPIYWTIFDVEGQDHFNLDQNIETAKEFLSFCIENDLMEGLQIILSGNGFRFCWPWIIPKEYKKAFMAMVDDLGQWVDLKPFKKSFLRLYAYRGHSYQEKKDHLKNIHLHLLLDPNYLWLMDADKYRELIAGKPDGDVMSWLPDILPRDLPPAPWFTLLNQYREKIKLKDSIFQLTWSKPTNVSYQAAWNQIDNYLDQQGIGKVERQIGGDRIIYKLSECPICHRKDGNPYITETGRLKCWHASCQAGEQDDTGNPIGLRPSEWIPDYLGADIETVFEDLLDGIGVDEARKRIADGVNSDADIITISTAGSGKTTTTLKEIIPTCTDQKVLYIGPTKKLSGEVVGNAEAIAVQHGVNVHWIRGREGAEGGREPTCYNMSAVERVQRRGFSPGILVCPGCKHNQKATIETIIQNGQRVEILKDDRCPYKKQFDEIKEPGFFISTHAQSHFLDLSKFDTVIIDENPAPVFMEKTRTDKDAVDKFQAGMSQGNKDVFPKIQDVLIKQLEELQKKGSGHARIYATSAPSGSQWVDMDSLWERAGITEAEKNSLAGDLAYYEQLEDETLSQWQRRLYKSRINLGALTWLESALGCHDKDYTAYIHVSRSKTHPFKFICFRKNVPNFRSRLILLDATGDKSEMDALFGRNFELIEASVRMPDCKRVWIQQALGKIKTNKLDDDQIRKLLSKAVSELKPTDKTVLIGTFKSIKENVLDIARELMPDKQVEAIHFFGNRGINEFKKFDAFISFGTPNVNHHSVLDESMVLFDKPESQQRWRDNIGKSELIQTLHRIRPVNGYKTIIIMGRQWPNKLGKPDIHIDNRRTDRKGQNLKGGQTQKMADAYERLKWFVSEHGFITKEIAWALGVGCSREIESLKLYQKNIESLIENSKGKNDVLCLLKYILIDIIHQKRPCSKLQANSLIVFGNPLYWNNLLTRLKEDFPDLPELKQSGRIYNHKKTKGLGYLSSVKSFYDEVGGNPFEPKSWEGVEQPEQESNTDNEFTEEKQEENINMALNSYAEITQAGRNDFIHDTDTDEIYLPAVTDEDLILAASAGISIVSSNDKPFLPIS